MKYEKKNDISGFGDWFDKEMNIVSDAQLAEAAKMLFRLYRSYIDAGFSEPQAFALILNMAHPQ